MNFPENGTAVPFFEAYERALQTSTPAWEAFYHDSFLFGGPQGAQSVQLADFVRFIPRRTEAAQALGLTATKLVSVDASPLDARYTLAEVVWQMTLHRAAGPVTLSSDATYVLMNQDGPRIVAQLDHQNLMEKIEALGV